LLALRNPYLPKEEIKEKFSITQTEEIITEEIIRDNLMKK